MEEDVVGSDDAKTLANLGAGLVEQATSDATKRLAALVEPGWPTSVTVKGKEEDLGGGIDRDLVVGQDEVELVELARGHLDAPSQPLVSVPEIAAKGGVFSFELSDASESAGEVTVAGDRPRRLWTEGREGLLDELVGARPAEAKGVGEVGDAGVVVAQNEGGDEAEGRMGLGEGRGGSVERHLGTPPASDILADRGRRGGTLTPDACLRCPAISSRRQATSRTDPLRSRRGGLQNPSFF